MLSKTLHFPQGNNLRFAYAEKKWPPQPRVFTGPIQKRQKWGPVLGLLQLRPVPRGASCIVFLTGPWTVTIVTRMTCAGASWLTGPWGLVRFASVACEWGPVVSRAVGLRRACTTLR